MEILFVIAVLLVCLYLFGVFDNIDISGSLLGMGLLLGLCVVVYTVFALIHKYLGPIIGV